MSGVWIVLSLALLAAAGIGFWVGWRLRSADYLRVRGELDRLTALWARMAAFEARTAHSPDVVSMPPAGEATAPKRCAGQR